jgi:hypothetical protein
MPRKISTTVPAFDKSHLAVLPAIPFSLLTRGWTFGSFWLQALTDGFLTRSFVDEKECCFPQWPSGTLMLCFQSLARL